MKKILSGAIILTSLAWIGCNEAQTVDKEGDFLKSSIEYLASDSLEGRGTGSPGERLAGDFIIREFEKIGLTPMGDSASWRQSFTYRPHGSITKHGAGDSSRLAMSLVQEMAGNNIIGFLDNGKDRTVIIGAHYDHLGYGDENSLHSGEKAIHNGADDNASGVAALLAIAKRLKGKYTSNNYLIMAFSGEEKGLWGSNYFCEHPTIALDSVNFMLNMDMVGRLNEEKKLAVYGVGTSPTWMEILPGIEVDSISITTTESGVGPSDHTSFYMEDIPVLHFFTGQHEDYHKPSDDVDKINFDGLESVIDYIEQVLARCDDKGRLEFVRTNDEKEETPDFKVTLGVMPDYMYSDVGMRIDGVNAERPAEKAGLQKGDIVIRMGDHEVTDMYTYMEGLGMFAPEETTDVVVLRDGVEIVVPVTWD